MGVAGQVLAAIVLCGTARAGVGLDWGKGLVTAVGIGIADRHAPSPAAAREPARRAAEDVARAQLTAGLGSVPLATGGKLADRLTDPAIKARIARAIAGAITVDAAPQTDGSWNVTLAVPIEAVRQALTGPRSVAKADDDPPIVLVEGVTARPAVGFTVGGIAAATLWLADAPAWAKDAPRVKAKPAARNGSGPAGAIQLVEPRGGPATLFVLLR